MQVNPDNSVTGTFRPAHFTDTRNDQSLNADNLNITFK